MRATQMQLWQNGRNARNSFQSTHARRFHLGGPHLRAMTDWDGSIEPTADHAPRRRPRFQTCARPSGAGASGLFTKAALETEFVAVVTTAIGPGTDARRYRRQGSFCKGTRRSTAFRRHRPGRAFDEGSSCQNPGRIEDCCHAPARRSCRRFPLTQGRSDRRSAKGRKAGHQLGAASGTDCAYPSRSQDRASAGQRRYADLHGSNAGQVDAIVLALAGLRRLGLQERATSVLDAEIWLPALAQGALAIEMRDQDANCESVSQALNDAQTAIAVACERGFQAALDGSCRTPHCRIGHYRKPPPSFPRRDFGARWQQIGRN